MNEFKSAVKVNFRVSPEDKPNLQGARCITHISVGQDYHEGEKFAETMHLINQTFSSCKTMLCDSLQRHTLKLTFPELDEDALYEKAMQAGDKWLDRNQAVFKSMTIPHQIIRWDTWLKHPDYPKNREIIEKLYANNTQYQQAVKKTIDKFLLRFQKRNADFNYEKGYRTCLPYLLEECSIIIPLWVHENCEFIIYPRPRTDAMETTYRLLVQKDYPHLLRPVALKFNKRGSESPYSQNASQKGSQTPLNAFLDNASLFEPIFF
jgi:tRNA-dependent cyclodipeptide synthase